MKRGTKAPTSPILSALRDACRDEALAVAFIEQHRWSGTPACPRCGDLSVYQMRSEKGGRNKDFRWRCRACKRMFTVRTGTTLEETRLPLRVWCFALWSACSNKKGVSALQISREMEISYKSALYLMHRIRAGMAPSGPRPKLKGTIEADETYVGGKPRIQQKHAGPRVREKWSDKVPVLGVVARGGDIRYTVVKTNVTAKDMVKALVDNTEQSSRLITDESGAYKKIGEAYEGGHETVCHRLREYVRGDVHSNTIEGAFSLLKRGMIGTFHAVSKKHLHRYVSEFEFRYNARKVDDGERIARAVKATEGKRLTYAQQLAG